MRRQFLTRVGSVRGWLAIWLMLSLILIPGCLPDGNKRPIAQISAKPTKGEVPLTVYFDGLDSYDPDGSIISYHWDFGDRVTCPPDCGSGDVITPTHQYMEAGTYRARLTVTDDKGAEDRDFVIIEVITPGVSPPEGQVLFFDDFEDGADPSWSAASGTWIVTKDGKYKVKEHWGAGFTYVKIGLSWKNYAVEVDIHGAPRYGGTFEPQYSGVVVRAQDDLNKVFLANVGETTGLCWYVIKNGDTVKKCVNKVKPSLPEEAQVRVEVIGNRYEAFVNGIRRTVLELEDSTFERGMPGLFVSHNMGVTFDNFKVTSLGG